MGGIKLLVAGAQGQVARSLVEAAKERNVILDALGRPELDLTIPDTIRRSIEKTKPDFVINTAAYTAVDKAENEPETANAINHLGAAALSQICSDRNIPIIHLSTDYVFDGRKPQPYDETDPTSPLGVYGSTKLAGELAVAKANHAHIILRTAWVYSPYGHNFVKTMLQLAKSRSELSVVDDQLGCPTYAPHIADAILQIVENLTNSSERETIWGIYNIAGSGETTWCGFAREIFENSAKHGEKEVTVSPISTKEYPTPARRPENSRLACNKLNQVFGVTMPDWQTGVSDCVSRLLQKTL